jgi:hypothetical protein
MGERVEARMADEQLAMKAGLNKLPELEQQMNARFVEEANKLRSVADDLLKSEAVRLEKHTEQIAERLAGKLRASEERFVEEAEKRLAAIAQASLQSLTQEVKTITAECGDQLRQKLEGSVISSGAQLEPQAREMPDHRKLDVKREIDRPATALAGGLIAAGPLHSKAGATSTLNLAIWPGAIAAPLLLLFVVLSINPVRQLRPAPPSEFFDLNPAWSTKQRVIEERLAFAYWESAVRYVQSKHAFGANLPESPPIEFKAEESKLRVGSSKTDSDSRSRYWRKLRQVWSLPEAWNKSYTWSTKWLSSIREKF